MDLGIRQAGIACEGLSTWLAHPSEAGRRPVDIEAVGRFRGYGNDYVVLRYRMDAGSPWLVGVYGFGSGSLDGCGHVWSDMKEHDASTAEASCRGMAKMLHDYWIARSGSHESGPSGWE